MRGIYTKIFNTMALSVLFISTLMPLQASAAYPAGLDDDFDIGNKAPIEMNAFKNFETGAVANDPRIIIKRIINVVMGFLGMLAVLVILYAGFRWMTAAGNKEHVEAAHKMLTNGVIGLVIIFSAWTLAQFVIYALKVSVQEVTP